MARQDWLGRGVLFQLDDYLTPKLSTGCSLTGVVLGKTLSVSKNRQFHVKHIYGEVGRDICLTRLSLEKMLIDREDIKIIL